MHKDKTGISITSRIQYKPLSDHSTYESGSRYGNEAGDRRAEEGAVLWRLFQLFFLLLAVVLAAELGTPPSRLWFRHSRVPIGFLSLAHFSLYVAVALTPSCASGFNYQRRCHKLTLALATDRFKLVKMRFASAAVAGAEPPPVRPGDLEIR
ncbi:hypothetical protein ZIOFF_049786 [Zingiber officinale]|uniref:Uncharacterized protein n=1 Tax=Zingiber officinale TaxID=94328 RepID=A0A8J5FK69_ZINOF|nr:hypothetical protein ZIOFF_049786 [Zingiber officinale]